MNQKLKKQFKQMKAKHPDTVLLFRTADFYEAYEEDALVVADVLGIIVTETEGEKVAAFPSHALDQNLPKLMRAGKRVAICDKLEKPAPKTEKATESQTPKQTTMEETIKKVFVHDIHPSPMNPRKTIDEGAIAELAASIKQHGLLQPITVRPKDGIYEIVMGERRYRAWQECMKDGNFSAEIPCIVKDMTDEEAFDAMITENLQRKDVDPIEEAFAFGQLLKTGKSIEDIALRFGKSNRFIQERIKLDNLLPELKMWVTKGWMNIGAAMHICKLTYDEQLKFFESFEDISEESESDPITKQEAINYTDNLFMLLERAPWEKDFEGACRTTCTKCPFNNANVGCLFYEMKPHSASCTNRERWNAKRNSWLLRMVEENSDVLVKYGEDLESGKTVVATEEVSDYYKEKCPEYDALIERIKEMGYDVVNKDDYFERYSYYREDDDRLKERLAKNEVYRCLFIEATYRGTEISIRYYEFKKKGTEQSCDEVKAMQLVKEYKENERKNVSSIASKLRSVLADMEPTELPTEALSKTESLVLMTLILRQCSYGLRQKLKINSTYSAEPQVLNYAREHTDEVNLICRDFLRDALSTAGVEYNTDLQECQRMLLKEWASDASEQVVTDCTTRLAKKQAVIEEQLTALGYKTDGTKIE